MTDLRSSLEIRPKTIGMRESDPDLALVVLEQRRVASEGVPVFVDGEPECFSTPAQVAGIQTPTGGEGRLQLCGTSLDRADEIS
jgi:hypothetical protein